MEGKEGSQQPQLVFADKEVVKRRKNMEGEEKEVMKRMKIMEGEEGSQQPQLGLADKDNDLIRLIKTLITDMVLDRARYASFYAFIDDEQKRLDEKFLAVEKAFGGL